MSSTNNDNSSTDLSESDNDNDFESVNQYVADKIKTYQLQFVKDEYYKFTLVGFFKELPSVELTKFEHEDKFCNITSTFIEVDENAKPGIYLFDMITMNVLKKDGRIFKLILSVEIENPKINEENKGNLMIWLEYNSKKFPLKTALTHPGIEKLPYYIVNELNNEKINEFINQ